jgi:hypothetical protein
MEHLVYYVVVGLLALFATFILIKTSGKSIIVNEVYEERNFKVKKEIEMVGLLGTKFPNIKLYDLERDSFNQAIEDSALYLELVKNLIGEIKIDEETFGFDVSNMFSHLANRGSDSYRTYVHIMRCLTNVNFEAFVGKGITYNFSSFNKRVMNQIEEHVNSIIVEVGTRIVERVIEMED